MLPLNRCPHLLFTQVRMQQMLRLVIHRKHRSFGCIAVFKDGVVVWLLWRWQHWLSVHTFNLTTLPRRPPRHPTMHTRSSWMFAFLCFFAALLWSYSFVSSAGFKRRIILKSKKLSTLILRRSWRSLGVVSCIGLFGLGEGRIRKLNRLHHIRMLKCFVIIPVWDVKCSWCPIALPPHFWLLSLRISMFYIHCFCILCSYRYNINWYRLDWSIIAFMPLQQRMRRYFSFFKTGSGRLHTLLSC